MRVRPNANNKVINLKIKCNDVINRLKRGEKMCHQVIRQTNEKKC